MLSPMAVMAVVGNVVLMVTYCMDVHLQNVTNLYIMGVAFCDMLIGVAAIPISLVIAVNAYNWSFHQSFCKVRLLLTPQT